MLLKAVSCAGGAHRDVQRTHLPSSSFTDDIAVCFKTGLFTKSLSLSGPVHMLVCEPTASHGREDQI